LPDTPSNPTRNTTPKKPERGSAARVALIGFGTVGRAVAKILCENAGSSLRLTHIANRNIQKKKPDAHSNFVPPDVVWTDDVQSILNSDAIDIVIELIGGLTPAEQIVRGALQSGKSVVTANKQLIARHGSDLLQLAARHGSQLEFGASVAGGVPVLPALRAGIIAETSCIASREF
jgi:homoserine dehydrogenase